MRKNKIGMGGRERKIRKIRIWVGIFTHTCGGKWDKAIVTKCCTQGKDGYVMNLAHFRVDISRDMYSSGGKKLGLPLYFVHGPYTCSTNVLLWFLFCSVLWVAHSNNGSTDFHFIYVKRRGLTQGRSFWGPIDTILPPWGEIPPKTLKIWARIREIQLKQNF